MASPQTENGYTKIANELFDALCKIRISGEARQVFDLITRKTYGYGKKEDAIALSQICEGTGLKKPTVCRAIKSLVSMNLIIKKDNKIATIYGVNKDFESWKPLSKKIMPLSKKITNIIKKDNPSLSFSSHTKETTTKENKEITTNVVRGNPHVEEIVNFLKEKLGSEKLDGSVAQNRRYAWLCLKKFGPDPPHGVEVTKKVINLAFKDPFFASRCTEMKFIYYNGVKIVNSAREKLNAKGKEILI